MRANTRSRPPADAARCWSDRFSSTLARPSLPMQCPSSGWSMDQAIFRCKSCAGHSFAAHGGFERQHPSAMATRPAVRRLVETAPCHRPRRQRGEAFVGTGVPIRMASRDGPAPARAAWHARGHDFDAAELFVNRADPPPQGSRHRPSRRQSSRYRSQIAGRPCHADRSPDSPMSGPA